MYGKMPINKMNLNYAHQELGSRIKRPLDERKKKCRTERERDREREEKSKSFI